MCFLYKEKKLGMGIYNEFSPNLSLRIFISKGSRLGPRVKELVRFLLVKMHMSLYKFIFILVIVVRDLLETNIKFNSEYTTIG